MAISNGSIGSQIQEMKKRKSGEAHRPSAVASAAAAVLAETYGILHIM